MIINKIEPLNKIDIVNLFYSRLKDFLENLNFNEQNSKQLIDHIISFIEIKTNCSFIKTKITLTTKEKTIILPFWPIGNIVDVLDDQKKKVKYNLQNNKIDFIDKYKSPIYVIYEVGYDTSIVENLPVTLIIEYIIFQYINNNLLLNEETNAILNKIGNIYGKD